MRDRSKICPPSRRGHRWRELKPDERLDLLSAGFVPGTPYQLDATRVCRQCGRLSQVNTQGLITLRDRVPLSLKLRVAS